MFTMCMSLQSSSLEFLASQGFDFNKMIREGTLTTFDYMSHVTRKPVFGFANR